MTKRHRARPSTSTASSQVERPDRRQGRRDAEPLDVLTRDLSLRSQSFNETDNTVDVLWTTGARVLRYDWWDDEEWHEELGTDAEHIDLTRLNSGRAPFLRAHRSGDLDDVLGRVVAGSATKVKDGWEAKVRLSDSDEDASAVGKIRSGIIANVSVGYSVDRWERMSDADDGKPVFRAVRWTPYEISAVPMGADPAAHVRGDSNIGRLPERITTRGDEMAGRNAPDETTTKVPEAEPRKRSTEETPDELEARMRADMDARIERQASKLAEERVAAERERQREIREIVKGSLFDGARDTDALVEQLIAEGTPLDGRDGARAQLLRHASDQAGKRATSSIQAGELDARETGIRGLQEAILHRAMPSAFKVTEHARPYAGRNLARIAEDFLVLHGVDVRGKSPYQICREAMQYRSGHSTSDFPSILANVTTVTMRKGYEMYPQGWRPMVVVRFLPDFKAAKRAQFTAALTPKLKPEGGPVEHGQLDDEAEEVQVATYAQEVRITHEALVNDRLDVFGQIPLKMGQAAASLESDLVCAILTGNPTMADGVALFHADHANLAGSAAAPTIDSIGLAIAAMAVQTDAKANKINAVARHVIVPEVKRLAVEQIIAPFVAAESAKNAPGYIRSLNVVSDPRLDAASTTAWYLAADPAQIDTIELSYLEGEEGLITEQEMMFGTADMRVSARLAVGAKALDHRGLYKNAGS